MQRFGCTLEGIVKRSDAMPQIKKSELRAGDLLYIRTHNSTYAIRVISDHVYEVTGGWFDRRGISPVRVGIAGCTWGGSAIKVDVVAACGLRLEFANRLTTSPIRTIFHLPHHLGN
jgi:hypothetical protein